jgi:lipopolysaccharide heptosyltransferase II
MKGWKDCKKILCIRLDNMGDVIMSSPAIRALKENFNCSITLLTSSMGAPIAQFLTFIDRVITFDAPWVKLNNQGGTHEFNELVLQLKKEQFDGAIIFTTFSQSALPAALISYLAGIKRRMAYCRENPYALLTDWLPDKEPYSFIQHQVQRDLNLVEKAGATIKNDDLILQLQRDCGDEVASKLDILGVNINKPWIIVHTGVSEPKRRYPADLWAEAINQIVDRFGYQVLLTGNREESKTIEEIRINTGHHVYNTAGILSLEEFITLIKKAPLLVSVNTSAVHIAAAMGTPQVVLYALSNPQHLPWKAKGNLLLFDIPAELRSRNEILQHTHKNHHPQDLPMVRPEDIVEACSSLLVRKEEPIIPPMIPLQILEQ